MDTASTSTAKVPSTTKVHYFSARRVARIGILAALQFVFNLIPVPGMPTTTFQTVPLGFGLIAIGPLETSIAWAVGRFFGLAIYGFGGYPPLLQIPYAIIEISNFMVLAILYHYLVIQKRWRSPVAWLVALVPRTLLTLFDFRIGSLLNVMVPLLGWAFGLTYIGASLIQEPLMLFIGYLIGISYIKIQYSRIKGADTAIPPGWVKWEGKNRNGWPLLIAGLITVVVFNLLALYLTSINVAPLGPERMALQLLLFPQTILECAGLWFMFRKYVGYIIKG
jgi:ABC-type Co2+ transport system permease subunit